MVGPCAVFIFKMYLWCMLLFCALYKQYSPTHLAGCHMQPAGLVWADWTTRPVITIALE